MLTHYLNYMNYNYNNTIIQLLWKKANVKNELKKYNKEIYLKLLQSDIQNKVGAF